LGNTGQVVANDLKLERITALQYNLFRLGSTNSIVVNYDGKDLCEVFKNDKFDRVLLDAPCTGMGIIARDPSIKMKKGRSEVDEHSEL
jgi:25S rRNA (cytosine2870-C5)-methyltransferase